MAYQRGLTEIADGVWAYLQPDGGWGWSNAGLVSGGGQSLIVDTLFDLRLTRRMLDDMSRVAPAAGVVVNTHANGDHCFGNALLPSAASWPRRPARPRWPNFPRRVWRSW